MIRPVQPKPSPLPIGELLIKEGFLTPEAIPRILRRQEQNAATGRPHKLFGELCVEMDLLGKRELNLVLRKYAKGILLGELLICHTLLTPEQLRQTLAIQQKYPKNRIGQILVKLGAISEARLTEVLSQQLDVPVVEVGDEGAGHLLGSLDPSFVEQNRFYPVRQADGTVTVAMEDPRNEVLLGYLQQSFASRILPAIAPAGQIDAAIKKFYAERRNKLRMTSIGPLDVSVEIIREAEKAGKTHGLDFMANPEFRTLTPSQAEEEKKLVKPQALSRDQEAVPTEADQQKTLIERWPFLLMEKAEAEKQLAKTPSGPSIDEILREKFGDTEQDLTKTFILSNQQADLQTTLHTTLNNVSVNLRETLAHTGPIAELVKAMTAPEADAGPPADCLIVAGKPLGAGKGQQQEAMLNYLIGQALADRATAIYFEPQGLFVRVRYRIDGVLHQKTALPPNLCQPMLAGLKQLCALDAGNGAPQRHRVQARFNEQGFELSIATYPSVWGESLALSFRYQQEDRQETVTLGATGLSPLNLRRLQKLLSHPGGMIVVTGPASAGKTTTLYAAAHYLNLLTQLIVTAENPVEQVIGGVLQGSWSPEGGSFADLIRSMGNLSPEVMLISELENAEAVQAGVELALGGAKVITSYQSFDTMGALQRLSAQGLESFLLASGNLAVLSQRLVRRLCPECKIAAEPEREMLDMLGLSAVEPQARTLWRAQGCQACHQGYNGQVALHELLVVNEPMREALLARHPATVLRELARSRARMITMAEDGYYKASLGLTSLAEVQRVAYIHESDAVDPLEAERIIGICQGEDKAYL